MSYPPGPPDNDDSVPEQPHSGSGEPSAYGPPSYGPPQQPGYSPQYGYGQPPTTNGKATIALVVGIASLLLSFCCLGVAGIVAVVLGMKARSEISASGGRQTGDGMALAGIITGAVGVLISLGLVVLLAILIATGNSDLNPGMYDTTY